MIIYKETINVICIDVCRSSLISINHSILSSSVVNISRAILITYFTEKVKITGGTYIYLIGFEPYYVLPTKTTFRQFLFSYHIKS